MISSPFPHHTIASLRQVGMMGLTPLRFELNRVKLFGTELDTHTHSVPLPFASHFVSGGQDIQSFILEIAEASISL